MKCIKCKKEIPEGSVYCNYCGKKQQAEKRRTRRRANSQGSVYKLSGRRSKPYIARLPASYSPVDGCETRPILGYYETKTEALNALNSAISGNMTDRVNATFLQIFNEWSQTAYRELSKSTITNYNAAHNHLKSLDNTKMRDIKANDVQKIIDKLNKPETAKKIRQLFSQLCKYAMSIDLISQNYSQFIKIKSEPKKEKEIFTIAEIRKLQVAAENSSYNNSDTAKIVLMMIFSGTRIGEITSIKYKDVYLNNEPPYMIGGIKSEAGKDRIIPIHHSIVEYVEYFYKKNGHSNAKYLLTNTKGGKLDPHNWRDKKYFPMLEELNMERKTPHIARHTYTTMLHAAGAKEENLIKLVGHADFETTTENYIHQSLDELYSTVEMLDLNDETNEGAEEAQA